MLAGPNGPVAAPPGISLGFLRLEGGSGFIQMSQSYDPATGNFELRNVVPGSYALQANGGISTARTVIDVNNADVTNVVLNLSGGINVAGIVRTVSGTPLPNNPPVRMQLRPYLKGVTHFVGAVPGAQSNATDGTFRFERILPGDYRPLVLVNGHFVKELRFDNTDVLNSVIRLPDDPSTAPQIEIVISPNGAQNDGVVRDEKNQPLAGVQAVLIPNQNRERTDLFKNASTDQLGRFNMRDVAPGAYKLFAWEALDGFEFFDPDFLLKYETLGKLVNVEESMKMTSELKIIPLSTR